MIDAVWSNKGLTLAALGRPDEAVEAVNKAIEIKPDNYASWSNKGVVLKKFGRKKEAEEAFEKAEEIKGKSK
jgi:Flp pilus assembly protein TadD